MNIRNRHLRNLVRYLIVGGIAAVVDLGIFWFLAIHHQLDYLLVAAFGFIVATAVNYQLCVSYIYISGQRFTGGTEVFSIYVVSAIGLLLHEIAIYLIHETPCRSSSCVKSTCHRIYICLELRHSQLLCLRGSTAWRHAGLGRSNGKPSVGNRER